MLATSTVRATDLGDAGEAISVVELSTGKSLRSIKVSSKASPAGNAPVELLFAPGANPPAAYVTNMYGGTLWILRWNAEKKDFDASEAFDFATVSSGVPLEIYFNGKADRLYVTTAKPGNLHIFDVSGRLEQPKLIKSIPIAEGAHHVGITPDERYAFVQNALLNLPGMSDGSVTVVDLQKQEVIKSMDTLKDAGFNPNCLVLLPQWTHAATVWNGPIITFSNAPGSNPALPANQDRMTPNVWITRGSTEGIYNIAKENNFTKFFSPADTAWAFGALSNYASLTYTDWEDWFGGPIAGGPIVTVGKPAVVHLISDDIYLSIDFTFWGVRNSSFAYQRSSPNVPEPSASFTLLGGLGLLVACRSYSRRRRKRPTS